MKGNAISIVHAIESGADRVKVIAERTGLSRAVVWARLHELKLIGAVRALRVREVNARQHGLEKRYALITKPFAT